MTEAIDCEHIASDQGRVTFMFYLGGGKSVCLCDMCYQRLKGEVLQDVLNEAISQAAKDALTMRAVGR